jgi:uncharacterized membrane protein AbrB (regulator of aidB expression)
MKAFLSNLKSGLAALSPGRFPYRRFALALLIGGCGGWLFVQGRLPLPWMLGSMVFCTVAALLRLPIAAPPVIRPPMTMVIGVMLGAGFKPDVIGQIPNWLPTIAGLVLFMCASGLAASATSAASPDSTRSRPSSPACRAAWSRWSRSARKRVAMPASSR